MMVSGELIYQQLCILDEVNSREFGTQYKLHYMMLVPVMMVVVMVMMMMMI